MYNLALSFYNSMRYLVRIEFVCESLLFKFTKHYTSRDA